jgi:DNA-binding IclR family transcriptional regulator
MSAADFDPIILNALKGQLAGLTLAEITTRTSLPKRVVMKRLALLEKDGKLVQQGKEFRSGQTGYRLLWRLP